MSHGVRHCVTVRTSVVIAPQIVAALQPGVKMRILSHKIYVDPQTLSLSDTTCLTMTKFSGPSFKQAQHSVSLLEAR